MTAPTPTLADFLLAQLAADEAAAVAARDARWQYGDDNGPFLHGEDAYTELISLGEGEGGSGEGAAHAYRHDPARVLADIKGKVNVVGIYNGTVLARDEQPADSIKWHYADGMVKVLDDTLRALAQPYRGAEGWQEAWDE